MCPMKFIVHSLPLPPFSSFFTTAPDAPGPLGPPFGARDPSFFPLTLPFADPDPFSPLTSQYFNVLSKLPLTRPFPSGVNATLYTLSRWPRNRSTSCPLLTSHIRTTVSSEPAATHRPSGEMATLVTPASLFRESGSLMVSTFGGPPCMSHIRAVLSPEPETMRRPSCEKSRE